MLFQGCFFSVSVFLRRLGQLSNATLLMVHQDNDLEHVKMLFSSQACVRAHKVVPVDGQHLPCSWDDLYNQLQFIGCLYKMNHLTCGFYLWTQKLAQRRNVHVEIRRSVWDPPKKSKKRCLQKLTARIGNETKRYKILISKKQ